METRRSRYQIRNYFLERTFTKFVSILGYVLKMLLGFGHGDALRYVLPPIDDLFVLNSYKDKLYIKMLEFLIEID